MKKIIIGLALMALALSSVKAESWEAMLRRWDLENARIAEQQAFDDAQQAFDEARREAKHAAEEAWWAAQMQQNTLDEINAKLDQMEGDQ